MKSGTSKRGAGALVLVAMIFTLNIGARLASRRLGVKR